jgi:VanZ family protein
MSDRLAESLRREHASARRAFAITALLVVAISLLPGNDILDVGPWDKLEHIIAYAVLAFVGGWAFPGLRAAMLLAVLLPALGILVEICQLIVPGRTADIDDAVANTIGVALVLVPLFILRAVRRRRSPTNRSTRAAPTQP